MDRSNSTRLKIRVREQREGVLKADSKISRLALLWVELCPLHIHIFNAYNKIYLIFRTLEFNPNWRQSVYRSYQVKMKF